MNTIIFLSSLIILICIALSKFSQKIGLPALLLFILLGMGFTHPHLLNISFSNFSLVDHAASAALLFIMFYGGFNTRWQEARKVAIESILLASIGVVLTAFLTAFLIYYLLGWPFKYSFLIGSVLSSTDAASVFAIIRSKKLALKYNTSSLLELESGSNDPASFLLTSIAVQNLSHPIGTTQLFGQIILQIGLALLIGYGLFKMTHWFLNRVQLPQTMVTVLIFALAMMTYSLTNLSQGNGYLAVYLFGILLGNSSIHDKANLVHFFDGLTTVMQMGLFFALGLLSDAKLLNQVFVEGLLVFVILTILVRPLVVSLILIPFKAPLAKIALISSAGLRGAASIAFAIMAHTRMTQHSVDIFHLVFVVVLLSILFQGSLLAWNAQKLSMTDDLANPLKSFSDYAEERPIEFIGFLVNDNLHPWAGQKIADLNIQPDLLIVLVIREDHPMVPDGQTQLEIGDKAVCIAKTFTHSYDFTLNEVTIEADSPYLTSPLSRFNQTNKLLVLIKRGNKHIIPDGTTQLQIDDEVIYLNSGSPS
ncbi:potassium/proton antiporter [Vaginisenegalia massiliensis]|uniref:potassium/proton antiporter n=1 Tax=Vaginisenegalia massiliensis TaxID=2058294 RepID=UPI0013DDEA39|nr:potassium/proton antiporter [Vaginisenegalia massiliensis]